jgi:nitrate reductase gamma subunit
MGALISLIAVAALALVGWVGSSSFGDGARFVIGVVVPGVAFAVFVVGIIARVIGWARSPVPFRIPTTGGQQKSLPWIRNEELDNPSGTWGVIGRMLLEVLFFRSLFRNTSAEVHSKEQKITYDSSKFLWAAGLVFHWAMLIVVLRHFRFFVEPVPQWVQWLQFADGFLRIGLPVVYMTTIGMIAGRVRTGNCRRTGSRSSTRDSRSAWTSSAPSKVFMDICVRCGACADKCHFFIGTGDPKNMPVLRAELLRSSTATTSPPAGKILGKLAGARPDPGCAQGVVVLLLPVHRMPALLGVLPLRHRHRRDHHHGPRAAEPAGLNISTGSPRRWPTATAPATTWASSPTPSRTCSTSSSRTSRRSPASRSTPLTCKKAPTSSSSPRRATCFADPGYLHLHGLHAALSTT